MSLILAEARILKIQVNVIGYFLKGSLSDVDSMK